LYMSWC